MKTKLCLLNTALTVQDISGALNMMKPNIHNFSIKVENNYTNYLEYSEKRNRKLVLD